MLKSFCLKLNYQLWKPENLIGLKWMEGIEDKTSGWSHTFETEKGVVFIDLPQAMTEDSLY